MMLSHDLTVLALANLTVGQTEDAEVVATLAVAAAVREAGGLQTGTIDLLKRDVREAIVEDAYGARVRD